MNKERNANDPKDERSNPAVEDPWKTFTSVFRTGRKAIARELDKVGLRSMELRVLLYLDREGPSTMNSLSSDTDVTGPWITGLVDELEKSGYVTRTRSRTDRRVIKVTLTPVGKEVLQKGIQVYTGIQNAVFNDLEAEEIDEFLKILFKLENSLRAILKR